MENNYVRNRVLKDKEFCGELYNGIINFFKQEDMVVLFSAPKRLIKAVSNEDKVYVFDDNDGKISVFYDDILPFEKGKELKKIVFINEEKLKNNPNSELFMNAIYAEKRIEKNRNDIIIVVKDLLTDKFAKIIEKMLDNNQAKKNNISEKSDFFYFKADFVEEKHTSYSSGEIKHFCDFLHSKNYMKKYEEKKYVDFSCDLINHYRNEVDYCFVVSKQIYDLCVKNECDKDEKYDNYTSRFFYHENNLIVENDNYCTVFDVSDQKNFKIYNLKDFSQYENLKERIKNNNVNLSDFSLIVENNQVNYIEHTIEYIILDLNSISKNLEEEEFDIKFPVDIKDYNYQRQYYQNNYGMNEFQFLTTMFLTPAASNNYRNDYLFDTKITYQKLDIESSNRNKKETKFSYCYIDHLSKIKKLNDDWINGLEYLIEKLKTDKPKAVSIDYKLTTKYGNEYEKCLEKTIEALQKVLTRVNKNKKDKILSGPK